MEHLDVAACTFLKEHGLEQELKFGDWYYRVDNSRKMLYIGEEIDGHDADYLRIPTLSELFAFVESKGYAVRMRSPNYGEKVNYYWFYLYRNQAPYSREGIGQAESPEAAIFEAFKKAVG